MLLAKFEFDKWFHFFKNKELFLKNIISPKNWWHHRIVIMQMFINEQFNKGPLFHIIFLFNRSPEKKSHTQYWFRQ